MKLYVTEKHSVAVALAEALNATKKDGYYSNGSVNVAWCIGHLAGLPYPEHYDPALKAWTQESLPIIPDPFQLIVKDDKKKQFNVVKELLNSASEIVNATDPDREGDLIFNYVYTLSGCTTPYNRILPNDIEQSAIKKVLAKEIPARKSVEMAGLSRSRADWLIGLNATRAMSIAAGTKITLGRVQTPTLALVAQRYLDNKNFVPTPYYPVSINLEKDGITFQAKLKENPTDKGEAERIVSSISDQSTCTLSERKTVQEKQPLPYYLSTLQVDAFNKYGFSSDKTLKLAQALYEKHKVTTYPRTDSGYLTTDIFTTVPDLIKNVLELHPTVNADVINLSDLPTNCINDKKVPNHHGIIPTKNLSAYQNLDTDEKNLFDLVALRFLAAFAGKCIKDKTKYEFDNSSMAFIASGTVIVDAGWRTIFTDPEPDEAENKEPSSTLPNVEESESLPTSNPAFTTKMTTAPKLYNEATLLVAMKSCGKNLDDKSLRQAMADSDLHDGGLATEATRAGIIKGLKVSLMEEVKKKFVPTAIGLSTYEQVKNLDIASPIMTAQWELKLDQIAEGQYEYTDFLTEIKTYTTKLTSDILAAGSKVDTDTLKLACPKCKEGKIIQGPKGYGCSRYTKVDPKCDFVVWKEKSGKTLSETQIKELIETGKTGIIKGFKYKEASKGSFDSALKLNLDAEKHYVEFFRPEVTTKTGEALKCPSCQSEIRINNGGAFCSKDCGVKLFRNKSDKKLTDAQLVTLITTKKTGVIKGFKKFKSTETFDAALILKDDFTIGFAPKK